MGLKIGSSGSSKVMFMDPKSIPATQEQLPEGSSELQPILPAVPYVVCYKLIPRLKFRISTLEMKLQHIISKRS
jgi:hypothetical protein